MCLNSWRISGVARTRILGRYDEPGHNEWIQTLEGILNHFKGFGWTVS